MQVTNASNAASNFNLQHSVQNGIDQRIAYLLKRAGIELPEDAEFSVSLGEGENIVVNGSLENKNEVLAALEDDKRLQNLLRRLKEVQKNELSQSTANGGGDSIAGVSWDDLVTVWDQMANDPQADEIMAVIIEKLKILDAAGEKYNGVLEPERMLEIDDQKVYYQNMAKTGGLKMPSLLDYFTGSGKDNDFAVNMLYDQKGHLSGMNNASANGQVNQSYANGSFSMFDILA